MMSEQNHDANRPKKAENRRPWRKPKTRRRSDISSGEESTEESSMMIVDRL